MLKKIFLVTLLAGVTIAFAQENYAQWSNYRTVILNTKASGANIAANQVNFPVLVRLTANDTAVFNHTLAGGADIRFAKSNGKHLPYQIEQWNPTLKSAALWVLADTIKGNDSSVCFQMYWGKTGAADSSNSKAVFDTAKGYQGVWHMNGTVGVGDSDATVNQFFATAKGSPVDTNGIVGRGKWFNHTNMFDTIIGSKSGKLNFTAGTSYTISAWVCPDTFAIGPGWQDTCTQAIVSKGNNQYALYLAGDTIGTNSIRIGKPGMLEYQNSVYTNGLSISMPTAKQWAHVAGRVASSGSNDTVTMYVNGVTLGLPGIGLPGTVQTMTGDVCIGRQSLLNNSSASAPFRLFWGMIDEVQMSNVARDTNWIKMSYQTQKSGSTVVALGAVQATAVTEQYSQWSNSTPIVLNTKATGATVTGTVTNFPVLVRLTAGNSPIFTAAQANGQDIRFAKPNGTHLKYQIEQWNSTTKKAAIWVLVDSIKGNDSTVGFQMYWGKAGAADSSNGKAVFDTVNGFQGVWHMNGTVGVGDSDATVNKFFATAVNAPADTIGMIGRGKWFNHTNMYDTIIGSVTGKLNFLTGTNYTLSAWICPDSFPSPGWRDSCYYTIISKGNKQYALAFGGLDSSDGFRYGLPEMMEYRSTWANTHPIVVSVAKQWLYVVGRVATSSAMDFDTVTTYVNGVRTVDTIASGTAAQVVTGDICIGRQSSVTGNTTTAPYREFWGMIDEVQMSNVARSADWIKLSYQNQKASQTLVFVVGTLPSGIAGKQALNAVSQNGSTIQLKVAGKTSVACHLASTNYTNLKITIVDLNGHTVWNTTINGSVHEVAWNGKTISGNAVVPGAYIAHITTLGSSQVVESASTKIMLMR